jgi:uncharacterized delta-60 repeat protein
VKQINRRSSASLPFEQLEQRNYFAAAPLDTTYAKGGIAEAVGLTTPGFFVRGGFRLGDGKTIVAGSAKSPTDSTATVAAFARVNENGTLDTTFGVGGVLRVPITSGLQSIDRWLRLGDGRYVGVGRVSGYTSTFRLNADFSLDSSYGLGGYSGSLGLPQLSSSETARNTLAVDAEGRLLVAGAIGGDFAVARLTPRGDLDDTFAPGASGVGIARLDFAGRDDAAYAVRALPDGRILLGGEAEIATTVISDDFAVARLNTDGSPDATFGVNGRATVRFLTSSGDVHGTVLDLTVDSAGRIAAAGRSDFYAAVARFTPNGQVDTSFNQSGYVLTDFFRKSESYESVAALPDGSLLLAGQNRQLNSRRITVEKISQAGQWDAGFGTGDGRFVVPDQIVSQVQSIELTPGGLAVYAYTGVSDGGTAVLTRLTDAGTADSAWGSGGVATFTARSAAAAEGRSVTMLSDGSTIVGLASPLGRLGVAKLTPAGALDAAFGDSGRAGLALPVAMNETLRIDTAATALSPDGKVYAAGSIRPATATSPGGFAVARYNADGSIDPSFGVGGLASIVLAVGDEADNLLDTLSAVAVQADGKLVAVGRDGAHWAAARLNTNGTLDSSFGTAGVVRFDAAGVRAAGARAAQAVAIAPDGQILIAGVTLTGGVDQLLVVRLTATGALDATFNTTGRRTILASAPAGADLRAIAVRPDGRILLAGGDGSGAMAVWGITAGGQDDTTFGSLGKANIAFSLNGQSYGASASAIAVRPDGRIAVAGPASLASDQRSGVALLDESGALVATFGSGGTTLLSTVRSAAGVALPADGSVRVAGTSSSSPARAVVAALHDGARVSVTAVVNGREVAAPGTSVAGRFTLTRSGPSSGPLTVDLSYGGTAVAGDDYTALPATVTIPSGVDSVNVDVPVRDDELLEGSETVIITSASAVGHVFAGPASLLLQDNEAVDAAETNETFETARPISYYRGPSDVPSYTLHQSDDVDYFRTTTPAKGLRVAVVRTSGSSPLELEVYDAGRQLVGRSAIAGATQEVTLPDAPAGTYFVRVRFADPAPAAGATAIYTLAVDPQRAFASAADIGFDRVTTIPITAFDRGGAGIAYNDTTPGPGPAPNVRPGESVDLRNANPATVLTDVRPGEWIEYTLAVRDTGEYLATIRQGNTAAGGTFHFELNGTPLTAALPVSVTVNGIMTPTTVPLNLPAGEHVLRIVFDEAASNGVVGEFESIALNATKPTIGFRTVGSLPLTVTEPETTGGFQFSFVRTGPTTDAVTVRYTVSSTATPGVDFTLPSGEVTIPAGATSANVVIPIFPDWVFDAGETITVTITPDSAFYITGGDSRTWTIEDRTPLLNFYEPNNTLETAAGLNGLFAEPTVIQAALAPNDQDFYRFQNSLRNVTATVTLSREASAGDLYLVLYDDAGNEVGRSDTPGLTESVSAPMGVEGTSLRVGVFGKDGASNGRYQLNFALSESTPPEATLELAATGTVRVRYNEPAGGVAVTDFRLTRDGVPLDLVAAGAEIVGFNELRNIETLIAPPGKYVLTLLAAQSNIQDLFGNRIAADASLTFVREGRDPARTLAASADAFVRDGASAGTNFGSAGLLEAGQGPGGLREAVFSFDLSGIDAERQILEAAFRIKGTTADGGVGGVPLTLFEAANTWTEAGITYSTRPAVVGSALADFNAAPGVEQWYEFNLTDLLRARRLAGATRVSFVLRGRGLANTHALFRSRESGADAPKLVLFTGFEQLAVVKPADNVLVPEGGSVQVPIRLNRNPYKTLTVTVTDASVGGALYLPGGAPRELTFTPENWNVPQYVTVASLQDADVKPDIDSLYAHSPSLPYWMGCGLEQVEDDLAPVTEQSTATGDLTVQDPATRSLRVATTELGVRKSATAGQTQEAYVKFSLANIPSASAISSVKLRFFGRTSATGTVPVGVYSVASTTWTTISWSTRPVSSTTPLTTVSVSGTTAKWYEFDVTAYVKQRKLAGATVVAFALKGTANTTVSAIFSSSRATTNRPTLTAAALAPVVRPSLVLSSSSVQTKEGGTSTFTVKLAAKPSANVTINLGSTNDTVAKATATTLTFTPSNWSTAQTVTVASPQDANTLHDVAGITLSGTGFDTRTVAVTQIDDDGVPLVIPTVARLRASHDGYARDGTFAGTSYGSATTLEVRNSPAAGNARDTFLQFNLAGTATASQIVSAKLRLNGRLSAAGTVTLGVYAVPSNSWTEAGLKWSAKPAYTTLLQTRTFTSTANTWVEFDVTAFLKQLRQSGASAVSLAVRMTGAATPVAIFSSDEASANRPELVITRS